MASIFNPKSRVILFKLIRAFLTVVMMVTFVFIILRVTGDPAALIMGPDASDSMVEETRREWGLDKPLWVQYIVYIQKITHGDFGNSYLDGRDAFGIVMEKLPKTLYLMIVTAIVTFLFGIPAGIYAALHRNSFIDRMTMTVSVLGFSMPNFFLGILLILFFSMTLKLLPTNGADSIWHYIIPVITMASAEAAVFARFTRSAMLEVLNRPYITTAISKGIPQRRTIRSHALPNASIPIVTVAGLFVGKLIAYGTVTENVFAWPGVGRLLVTSVSQRDVAVVQVIILMVGTTMVVTNLLVDLAYGWLDPRVADSWEE